jgi:hypothetical protein
LVWEAPWFTPIGKTLLLPIAGEFRLFETATGKEEHRFPRTTGRSCRRIPLTAGCSDKVLQRFVLPGWRHAPVAFSADGRVFATAIQEPQSRILVYEIASGKVRCAIRGFRGLVRSLAFRTTAGWPE